VDAQLGGGAKAAALRDSLAGKARFGLEQRASAKPVEVGTGVPASAAQTRSA